MARNDRFSLFSDFNCPFCYALHERLHNLNLLTRCNWQGVQHAPHLPRPMKAWQGTLAAELRHEVAMVGRLSPELPLELPAGKPNTGHAIVLAAEHLDRDREAGMRLVRAIYRAFWWEGRDISDPRVLVGLARDDAPGTHSGNGQRIAGKWSSAWEATGQFSVPMIVAPDGNQLVGCVPTEMIVDFFTANSVDHKGSGRGHYE